MQAVRGLTFSSKSSATLLYSHSNRLGKVLSSNLWSVRSFAASLASHSPQQPITPRKKLSKDERTKLITDFVDKYRASNAGKFPSTSAAQRHAGGSYYTVKNILQQLQYNPKNVPSKTQEETSLENATDVSTLALDNKDAEEATSSSARVKEETLSSTIFFSEADLNHQRIGEPPSFEKIHSDQIKLERKEVTVPCKDEMENIKNASLCNDSMDLNEQKVVVGNHEEPSSVSDIMQGEATSFDSNMDLNEPKVVQENVEEPSDTVDKTHSDHLNLKHMEVSHPDNDEPETSNNAASSDGSLDSSKPQVMQENVEEASEHDTLERSELPRDTSTKEDEGSAHKPSIWGSLRSFADGIINLWKNK